MLKSGLYKKKYISPVRLSPDSFYYTGALSRLGLLIGILKKDGYFIDLKKYLYSEHSPIDHELIFDYSTFFEAKTLIIFFESMPKEDQQMEIEYQKSLTLRPHITNRKIYIFDELVNDFKNIEKEFIKLEKENKEKLEEVLNLELKYKISFLQGYLSVAMLNDLDESDPSEYMNSREDFCHMRTMIEYFRLFIYWLGKSNPDRLEKIPFFGEFEKRLKILDIYLKWKLDKPTRLRFYNDPSFWWSDKTYTFPDNTVTKDLLPGEVSQEPILNEKDFLTNNGIKKNLRDLGYGKMSKSSKIRRKLSEDVKNLFPLPDALPNDFFDNFKYWSNLFGKKYTG